MVVYGWEFGSGDVVFGEARRRRKEAAAMRSSVAVSLLRRSADPSNVKFMSIDHSLHDESSVKQSNAVRWRQAGPQARLREERCCRTIHRKEMWF